MYRHYLGPNYYSFTWGGVRFLGLDSIDVDDMGMTATSMRRSWSRSARSRGDAGHDAGDDVQSHPVLERRGASSAYRDEPPAPTLITVNGRTQFRHLVSNTADVLAALKPHRLEIALGGHLHARETLEYQTDDGVLRFHQAAAVVGPSKPGGLTMASGVTLYRVKAGTVDGGTFLPL